MPAIICLRLIGSRLKATHRTLPPYRDLRGEAHPNATVSVDGTKAQRGPGGTFYHPLPLDNTSGPVHDEFTVLGVRNHIGPEDEDATTTHTGRLFLAATPEEPTHDFDGNLTQDGRWVVHWNADNRLSAMETRPDLPATLPRQRLQFTYDHAGRRVRKQVLDWNGTEFTPTTDTWFLWHGWQMLAEGEFQSSPLNTENFKLKTSFTWGHDLTGTFKGAGTIGGLLATHNHQLSTNHFPTYDGNGNLVAAIDATTGEPAARFTYSPFGETLTASGPAADQINFRFSTKYTDPETGLLYYGLRYLHPQTGTWLNRDPIEEEGGLNLYGFVGNDGVNAWDYLGLSNGPLLCECATFDLRQSLSQMAPEWGPSIPLPTIDNPLPIQGKAHRKRANQPTIYGVRAHIRDTEACRRFLTSDEHFEVSIEVVERPRYQSPFRHPVGMAAKPLAPAGRTDMTYKGPDGTIHSIYPEPQLPSMARTIGEYRAAKLPEFIYPNRDPSEVVAATRGSICYDQLRYRYKITIRASTGCKTVCVENEFYLNSGR